MDESNESVHMENTLELERVAYIAGDTISGIVNIESTKHIELMCVNVKLVGQGIAMYHKAKYRAHKLCQINVPAVSVKEHCVEAGRVWRIPISIRLKDDLVSSIDSGKKGRVVYYIYWELQCNSGEAVSAHQEVVILSKHSLDDLPRTHEVTGTNQEEEEYDLLKLELYSPASAYLPGEMIQFRAYIRNFGKKPVKKMAVLLIQNVLFYKSSCEEDRKGRTRSYLMSVKEKSLELKSGSEEEWTDEIQIPDPVPPSADGFHKVDYELVLVAINKGKKSDIRAVFDQARMHFDLERYQDDYFRDFLPHAVCNLQIGSNHGQTRSACMSGDGKAATITTLNDIWKLQTKFKSSQRKMPKTSSHPKLARITFNANPTDPSTTIQA